MKVFDAVAYTPNGVYAKDKKAFIMTRRQY
jgi:hypothetical protein